MPTTINPHKGQRPATTTVAELTPKQPLEQTWFPRILLVIVIAAPVNYACFNIGQLGLSRQRPKEVGKNVKQSRTVICETHPD